MPSNPQGIQRCHGLRRAHRGIAHPRIVAGAAAVVVIVLIISVFGFRGQANAASSETDLFNASKLSFEVTTTANGELAAKNETKLVSQVEGQTTITELVSEGTFVAKGDVLVRLSSEEIQKQLENELLSRESARADLISAENEFEIQKSDNESDLRKAELKLELARLELQKWEEGDVKQRRQENLTSVDKAERELSRLKEKFERSKELLKEEFISRDEYQQDELRFLEAESTYQIAVLRRDVYEEFEYQKEKKRLENDVIEALAELERVKTKNSGQLAQKEANLNNRRAQLSIREEKVRKLEKQLENCTVLAPTDGLVVYATSLQPEWRFDSRGPLQVGRQVHHNEELIVLPDTSSMVAKIKIHESMVGKIRPGQPARVTIDAAEGAMFSGLVEEIGIMAEAGGWRDPNLREYEVKISLALDNSGQRLKPSMRCEATVILDNVTDAISVPTHAIFNAGPVQFVYVPHGGKYEKVPVAVGRRSDTYCEVLAGLKENASVLLREPAPNRIIAREFDEETINKLAEAAGPTFRRAGFQMTGGMNNRGAKAEDMLKNMKSIEDVDLQALTDAMADETEDLATDEEGAELAQEPAAEEKDAKKSGEAEAKKPAPANGATKGSATKPSSN